MSADDVRKSRTRKQNSVEVAESSRAANRRRVFVWIFATGTAALVLAGSVLVSQILGVRANLTETASLTASIREDLSKEDQPELLDKSVLRLADLASETRRTTDGTLWGMASAVPVVGANFTALRDIAVSLDDIVNVAVLPLSEHYQRFHKGAFVKADGTLNLDLLESIEPTVSRASQAVHVSHERLRSIDSARLLPLIADPLSSAVDTLAEADAALETAASAVKLLPPMLGTHEKRTYLLLIQNNAEARATGGIPGALGVLTADDGEIELIEQSSAVALGDFDPPLSVDTVQEGIFTARLGRHMQNVNLTPDFPTAAATARKMWEKRHGSEVDGVIALDPAVLASMLRESGPIELHDAQTLQFLSGTTLPTSLTADNVVTSLLSDVYDEISDPTQQDMYFAAVASSLFQSFTGDGFEVSALFSSLASSVEEQRVFLWSAHENEQATINTTTLSGSVTGANSGGANFGVYFNDGTGAKMDYYAHRTVSLAQTCPDPGYSNYTVRVSVTNTAPQDAVDTLPPYVTGNGRFGVTPGHIRTNYVFYGPAQSFAESAHVNGVQTSMGSGLHAGRPVATVTVELAPGESAELQVHFSNVVQKSVPQLRVTPGVRPVDEVILPFNLPPKCGSDQDY